MADNGSSKHGMATKAIHAGQIDDEFGSAAPAIYQSSTFKFDSTSQGSARFRGDEPGYIYTRLGNPTIRMLEDNVAALEGGARALACSSGMAATNSLFFALLDGGDHVVMSSAVYGPSRVILEKHWSRFGVTADFVDTTDPANVERALEAHPNTKLVFIESPANPTLSITNIAACAELAHSHGALLVVDNTFMSPVLQRPFEHGADIVMHSVTKFINGHSDVVGGILVTGTEEQYSAIKPVWTNLGGTMDPHQAWLVLRGIKTITMRVMAAQVNAELLAPLLVESPKVGAVYYPGLRDHPHRDVHERQADGPGSLISFEMSGGYDAARRLLDNLELMTLAVSLGGVETLIQHPASMTHYLMTPEGRSQAGITDGLVRLSVGCEDAEDLAEDLKQALDKV